MTRRPGKLGPALAAAAMGLVVLGLPAASEAARLLAGDITETTEAVAADVFLLGNSVTIRHAVRDDAYAAGNSVSVTADVGGDIMAAGQTIRLSGAAGDDIAVAGHEVTIAVPRADDIFAAGSALEISGEEVAGAVYLAGSRVRLSGHFVGPVRIAGEEIAVAAGTSIAGDLLTFGPREPTIEEGVTIAGSRRHQRVAEHDRLSWIRALVRGSITWFITGLALLWLFRSLVIESAERALARSGRALGIGALGLVMMLPLGGSLLFTGVAWPLGVIVLASGGALLTAAHVASAVALGMWLVRLAGRPAEGQVIRMPWQPLIAGVVVLKLLALVPVVGWLAVTVVTALGLGALLESVWQRLRAGRSEADAAAAPV